MFLNNFYLDKFFDLWRSKKLFRVAVVDCSKHFLLTLQDILNPFMSFTFKKMQVIKISQMFPFLFIATELYLSYDVASGSEITPCNKICKPLVVYRFSGNVMTSITTLRTQ